MASSNPGTGLAPPASSKLGGPGDPAPTHGRAQPRDLRRLELDGAYAGWWAEVDVDIDLGTYQDLQSGDLGRVAGALSEIVTAWNFADKRGDDLPLGAEGFRRVSSSLLAALLAAFRAELALPKG